MFLTGHGIDRGFDSAIAGADAPDPAAENECLDEEGAQEGLGGGKFFMFGDDTIVGQEGVRVAPIPDRNLHADDFVATLQRGDDGIGGF